MLTGSEWTGTLAEGALRKLGFLRCLKNGVASKCAFLIYLCDKNMYNNFFFMFIIGVAGRCLRRRIAS